MGNGDKAEDAHALFVRGSEEHFAGNHQSAIDFYQRALTLAPLHKDTYLHLANALNMDGQKVQALSILCQAEGRFPDDMDIKFCRGKLAQSIIPGWHLSMLSDQARNNAFQKAIESTVKPGDIVLDLGTGSGLLAMMAARAGAKHVYACELNEALAVTAREIIRINGLSDKITVIHKNSKDITIGQDIPLKADVLVAEVFDHAQVGEGAIANSDAGAAWLNEPAWARS